MQSVGAAAPEGCLTTKEYWRENWSGVAIPYITRPMPDIVRVLRRTLPSDSHRLLEVGCAPGGWLAFFQKHFAYRVAGVEYVAEAAALARDNLARQGVEGDVICGDFFDMGHLRNAYDVVFSGGFVEHFEDTDEVVARIADTATHHVVTLIPNLYGFNGAILKAIRPAVYEKHVPIDLAALQRAHENAGLVTDYCGYAGGIRVVNIAEPSGFFATRPRLAASINRPVDWFNQALQKFCEWTPFEKSAWWWSPSLLYVGRHPEATKD